jgi:tetratricopeptide (TPR) repeat protein
MALFGDLLCAQNALLSGGATTGAALQRLAGAFENIRAAWEHACALVDAAWLEAAAEPMHKFSEGQGRYTEGEALFRRALAAADAPTTHSRLSVHYAAILLRLGRLPEGLAAAESAQSDLPADMIGFANNLLGILYAASGKNPEALTAYEQSLAAYRQSGDTRQIVKPLANLGPLLLRLDQVESAVTTLREGLELARELGDQRGQTHFLNNLGLAAFQQERYDEAAGFFHACAELCRELANDGVRMVALYNLAEIAVIRAQPATALPLAEAAIQLAAQFGDRRNQALALRILGIAHLQSGDSRAARDRLTEALRLAQATQSPPVMLDAAYGWAHLLYHRGETTRAAQLLAIVRTHPATEKHLLRQVHRFTADIDLPALSATEAADQLASARLWTDCLPGHQ